MSSGHWEMVSLKIQLIVWKQVGGSPDKKGMNIVPLLQMGKLGRRERQLAHEVLAFCYLAVWPWTSHCLSLGFRFPI